MKRLLFSSSFALLAACSGASATGDAGLTFQKDVRPIVEAKCQVCHVEGSFTPFALTTYQDVYTHRAAIASAVGDGRMPPWPPSDSCGSYQHDRSLSPEQRAAVVAWAGGLAPEGEASTFVAPDSGTPTALRVDTSLAIPMPYQPVSSPDEYRCFVLDWPQTTTKYVTGLRVVPGAIAEVHHAIIFQIAPADVAAVQALDAADPAEGYSCFGGSGVNAAGWVGAWVPGSTGNVFPADTGIAIAPGSKLVVQVHYNTANTAPVPDQGAMGDTRVELQLADTVKTPAVVLKWANPQWVRNHTMTIDAGDPDSVHAFEFTPGPFLGTLSGGVLPSNSAFQVWTAGLHMHARGAKATLQVTHPDGSKDCLLQIDDWSFHWQGSYDLVKPVKVGAGDSLSIECHFDNSGNRQPIVNGIPAPVGPVNWGETTEDEMCLGIMYATP